MFCSGGNRGCAHSGIDDISAFDVAFSAQASLSIVYRRTPRASSGHQPGATDYVPSIGCRTEPGNPSRRRSDVSKVHLVGGWCLRRKLIRPSVSANNGNLALVVSWHCRWATREVLSSATSPSVARSNQCGYWLGNRCPEHRTVLSVADSHLAAGGRSHGNWCLASRKASNVRG